MNNANLRIIPLGNDLYRFEADGCKLDRFAIWNKGEGEQPQFYTDIKPEGNNSYSKILHIKNINGIRFDVYDGPEKKDFRGKISVKQNNNYNHSSNSNSHSNSSTKSEKKRIKITIMIIMNKNIIKMLKMNFIKECNTLNTNSKGICKKWKKILILKLKK